MNYREQANELLLVAGRQYQHNDCSGLLHGYDLEDTQNVVIALLSKLAERDATIERLEKK